MSETKKLLNDLLCDIYGEQQRQARRQRRRHKDNKDKAPTCGVCRKPQKKGPIAIMASGMAGDRSALERLDVRKLIDVCAILKVEILMMGYMLERVLIVRDRLRRHQEVLCEFVTTVLVVESHDAQPKMRFSLSPPPPKAVASVTPVTTTSTTFAYNNNNSHNHSALKSLGRNRNNNNMTARNRGEESAAATAADNEEAASDYNQWLHAMKLVARLPGGTPPEFRRKLWLSLADKYLKSKNVDWSQQREKCFCEEWREDDEELGIQIVKDLHRTGSNLCTGPAGSINQAKLKRILLGYARYNPEVGYCQGFNMLGALILQVMDKEEEESMKVMIYLVEGVLPTGYFCGSMGGLQADMGVFRELMQTKLPRLAKHLQKLQGPVENAYEPPLTNVFTMQWFLTMFCTCLPMSCVLRVWDLVLIEGSDVLLRTALVLWSLLEERVLNARTADDFYGKMGSFSSELLNGHLIDSNGLIEKVVQLGPIPDIRQLRDKHLYNIAPLRHKQGLQLYYDDEETHSDEESRLAVATVWGLNWGRRGSVGTSAAAAAAVPHAGKQPSESKDRLALDISLLKKQYDRLRERQKQAHVILTTACSTASRQTPPSNAQAPVVAVNQLLHGRSAIVMKGMRVGAPRGAIPPARKPSLPAVLHTRPAEKQLRRGETLLWRDTDPSLRRRDSLTWKEIKAERATVLREGVEAKSQKLRSRLGKSDSSSYSEDSDGGEKEAGEGGSSSDTSLCDDDDPASSKSLEKSPRRKAKLARKLKEAAPKQKLKPESAQEVSLERRRPKSWAPTTHEIPFMLMGADSGDEKEPASQAVKDEEDSATESGRFCYSRVLEWSELGYSNAAGDLASSALEPLHVDTDILELPLGITSTSQLSPLPDIAAYLSTTTISPLPTPKPTYVDSVSLLGSGDGGAGGAGGDGDEAPGGKADKGQYDVSDDGVTNQYFERVNSVERPNKLELFYSLNDEERGSEAYEVQRAEVEGESAGQAAQALLLPDIDAAVQKKEIELEAPTGYKVPQIRDDNIPGENKDDYKEALSMTIVLPRKDPLPMSNIRVKRRDPRRKTLTRSSTIELEERFQALERRLSQDVLAKEPQSIANRQCDTTKQIPSTAALEERYNTLEKQLSAEKQSRESKLLCQEATDEDAECVPKLERIPTTADLETRFNALTKQMSSNEADAKAPIELKDDKPDTESGCEAKEKNDSKRREAKMLCQELTDEDVECVPKLERIPTTADLETRFNALTKQMSSSEADAKAPIELKDDEPDSGSGSGAKEKNEKTSKLHEAEETKSESKQTASKSETSDSRDDKSKAKTEPPRLKKLPSTAELEDRFNALERKLSVAKSSPAKTKKEPPDGEQPKEPAEERKEELPTKVPATQEVKPKSNEKSEIIEKSDKETTTPKAKEEPKSQEKPQEAIKTETKAAASKEDKAEAEPAKRKIPPSTEELEKRFEALEKRLSTASFEPSLEAATKDNEPKAKADEKEPKQGQEEKQLKTEEKLQSAMKTFDDKCKNINTTLTDEQTSEAEKAVATDKAQILDTTDKASLETESKTVETKAATTEPSKSAAKNETEAEQPTDLTKRRASEPPSTEDLEKRYETLKRRMSSRNHFAKDSSQNETVNEALERIEQEVIAEMGETGAEQEQEKKQPPTTADLESRYEALHAKEATSGSSSSTKPTAHSPPQRVDVAIEAHIPEPPPPPPVASRIANDPAQHKQRAIIEELQSKMKGQSPGEENLKPSDINPQRKRLEQQRQLQQRPTPMGDETSEAPANTAYYRSGNYEPWQAQKMVRRFSDLPSRADLENRLQFLEKQLYKKFYKQRCASDSEVASMARMGAGRIGDYDRPSTSQQAEAQLEQRVLALEKQLSDNSLKLLEAMREKVATKTSDDSGSPRRLSTDTVDTTGKELVRYTHFGEVDETDSHKPFNISINIKMMVNKDKEKEGDEKKRKAEHLTTEELRRRLEQLEQQLLEERAKNGTVAPECETVAEEAEQQPLKAEESESSRKEEKESHNQSVKSDVPEKEQTSQSMESAEPETVKETKTLENEEKAQVRTKETVTVSKEQTMKNEGKAEEVAVKNEAEETKAAKEKTVVDAVQVKPDNSKPEQLNNEEAKAEETKANKSKAETSTTLEAAAEKTIEPAKDQPQRMIVNASDIGPVDPNNQTVVLLMDNEPKAHKVRRLTRANTEELEDLFQALEKQLNDRNLVKSENGKLVRVDSKPTSESEQAEQAQAITDLTKEIEEYTNKPEQKPKEQPSKVKEIKPAEEIADYDWGPNPVKHHLKRKTVYLPSTKELEARFRSLERQIKLLEDVEKIDVEYRLTEIERKIKLQYSLSHEKDLNKYLDLCEGKGLDDEEPVVEEAAPEAVERSRSPARRSTSKSPYTSPYTSPSRKSTAKSPYTSPSRKSTAKSPYTSPTRPCEKTPHTSPARAADKKRSPYTSPSRRQPHPDDLPISDDLEYKYRVLDLVRSKSKDNLAKRKIDPNKKPPIHPLEMLLDPSPDDSEIPTTGELEHRIRLLDEKLKSPNPNPTATRHKSRSRSPTIDDMKRKKMLDDQRPKTPVHNLERMVCSPTRAEPPTTEQLEQRMRALEEDQRFDFKTQKDYKEFNQKLKDVISPSLSFEEFKAAKSREQSPRRAGATTPKSALRREDNDWDYRRDETPHYHQRPTSPKVIRFRDEDEYEEYDYEETRRSKSRPASERERMVGNTNDVLDCIRENTKILQRMLKKTLPDHSTSRSRSYSSSHSAAAIASSSEGLDELGSRLMRETSPITRTGTHTGVPLRTGDNINERLSSIKNSIKSIDSLCEEKPYRKEKCQRYIDSLFSDSLHFASKKSSAEDLAHSHSRSESRGRGQRRGEDYTPAIRITSSEHRSLGSAESIRTTSPLRAASPLHHRSHRDISRELSPRRRRDDEEREERESSRVRRDNMLPNYFLDNRSDLSSGPSSLTKFHKVDRQLEETYHKYSDDRRSASRSPLSSPYESTRAATTTATRYNTTTTTTTTTADSGTRPRFEIDRPVSPYRQPYDPYKSTRSNTPVYQPAKLDIRHTTVTSTFYDRFLMEKQIEKETLSRPPSRSPVVSPSVTSKSYTDLPQAATTHKYSHDLPVPTTTTSYAGYSGMSSSYAGPSSSSTQSQYSYLSTNTATAPASGTASAEQITGSSTDLRLRSSDNIVSQLGSAVGSSQPATSSSLGLSYTSSSFAATTASTLTSTSATASTTSAYVPYTFTSSFTSRLGSSTADPVTTSSALSYATGVYNPMMSFTLRQPLTSATSSGLMGQYTSGLSPALGSTTTKTSAEADRP